jgi:hypothetical protein
MTKPSMQRAIEEQHAPKHRTGPRRHPRAQVLGFTPRQWPFIFELIGNWLFRRPVFRALQAVLALGAGPMDRCRPPPTRGQGCRHRHFAGSARHLHNCRATTQSVYINNRFILNTIEQFILYFITILAGSEARSVANHE